jgi:hypothetical protein
MPRTKNRGRTVSPINWVGKSGYLHTEEWKWTLPHHLCKNQLKNGLKHKPCMVTHAYNLSYWGCRNEKEHGWKPALVSKMPKMKKG